MSTNFQPDLHAYAFENDPEDTLKRLQTEDPVHWSQHGYWFLTRYEDVQLVLSDHVNFSSQQAGFGANNPIGKTQKSDDESRNSAEAELSKSLALSFNQQDPPNHTRVRALVNRAFSRKEITDRAGRIQQITDELLAVAKQKGTFDLVTDFAFHLPIIVASEIIGVPAKDREQFRQTFERAGRLLAPKRSEADWSEGLQSAKWLDDYMKQLIADRRQNPKEDLVTALIEASESQDKLTTAEIVSAIATIYTAAGTTTERSISSGAYLLLQHPDQLEALRADPSLMDTAMEEILRFHHPNQTTTTNRRAVQDVELGGKIIKAGDTVRLSLGAANRDPRVFDDAETFDIRRKGIKHLSFGRGIHFCVGTALSRYEAKSAYTALFLGEDRLQLVTDAPVKDPKRADRYESILVKFAAR